MKKILITGGSGFLGKNLAYKLKNNFKIYMCSRNIENGNKIARALNVDFIPLDISNYDNVDETLFNIKPDIIIHSAASKFVDMSEKFVSETINSNIVGSKNLIICAKKNKCKKFIAISSDKASPPFTNLYAITKATMERSLININSDKKLDLNIVRFGNLPWSTGSVLNIWEDMKKTKVIYTTGPDMTRFFYTIDQASLLIKCLINDKNNLINKVIIPEMKSLKIQDLLIEFSKKYKVKWKKTKKREMDKFYETLIPNDQYYEIKYIKQKKIKIFVLNLKKVNMTKKNIEINSINSKKFSKKEIIKIINNKPKFL